MHLDFIQMVISGSAETPYRVRIMYDVVDGEKRKCDQVHVIDDSELNRSICRLWKQEVAKIKAAEGVP